MYAIARIDTDANGTHAWLVTLQRCGRITHKMSTDGVYGGRRPAFQAAMAYRNALAKSLRPLSRRAFCRIKKKNNRSCISGVTRISRVEQKGSIKNGEQQTRALALRARQRALKALNGAWARPSLCFVKSSERR